MENMQFKLDAPWEEVKEHLKEVNTNLTDNDLDYKPGQENELLESLSAKMGRSKEDVKGLIESVSYSKGMAG